MLVEVVAMFKKVCSDMEDMIRHLVIGGIEFRMWSSSIDGNVGVHISSEDAKFQVDISQYMSPTSKFDYMGQIVTSPIGLSVEYTKGGKSSYEEGSFSEDLYNRIVSFVHQNA